MAEENTVISNEPTPEEHSGSLSDNPALFDLPLQPSHQNLPDRETKAPPEEPPQEPSSKPNEKETQQTVPSEETVQTPQEAKKALFETQTQKEEETTPFKSKDAEAIRNEPAPKGVHAKNWESAKTKWAGIVEAKDHQINKLQKEATQGAIALQKENEKLAKRVADLSGYESVIDYQASEKFQTEFDVPLKKAQDGLIEYIKSQGATPEGLEEFKKGINDEKYLFQAIASLEKEAPTVASRMRFEVGRILDLKQRKEMALEDVKQNHTKFVEERRSEGAKKTAQFEEGLKQAVVHHTQVVGQDKYPSFPFLVKMKAPEGASSEVQKQVEDHNKQVEMNLADLEKAARNDSPQERVRLAVGYMTAVVQMGIIKDLTKQLQEAQDFVKRVKKAGAPPEKASGASLPQGKPEYQGSLSDMVDVAFPRR